MLRESGRVVAVEDGAVWVETIRSSLCGSCAAKAGCGHGVLARASGSKGLIRALETERVAAQDCAVNDEVDIELPEAAVLKGSLLVYLLPLVLSLVSAVLAESYGEVFSVLAFCTGLATGFALVRLLLRRDRKVPGAPGTRPWGLSPAQFEPRLAAVRKKEADIIVNG